MARTPIHPGEILGDELEEVGLSAKKLAEAIEVPPNRLYQILSGKRSMTADTALRLGQYFGMTADFWMNVPSHARNVTLDCRFRATKVFPQSEYVAL